MSLIYKEIQGGTSFNLTISEESKAIQRGWIRLICRTSGGAITINLPKISSIGAGAGLDYRILIDDADDMSGVNNITINCDPSNTIENGSSIIIAENGGKREIYISSDKEYGVLGMGGGVSLIQLPYADLLGLSNTNLLVAGQKYLITDFRVKQNIPKTGSFASSPLGTLWNADGWADLTDYQTRAYVGFEECEQYSIGAHVLIDDLVMWDVVNNRYYTFKFSQWTSGGVGGGFEYTRTEILSPTTLGTPVLFTHTNYGVEVDNIDVNVSITRAVSQGIYNPLRETGWNSQASIINSEIVYGSVEPLIVEAINVSQLSRNALSTVYQNDELLYDLIDLTYDGGDRGRISYRKDTTKNISTYYDWRTVKFRRWESILGSGIFNQFNFNGNSFVDILTFDNSSTPANCYEMEIGLNEDGGIATLNNITFGQNSNNNKFGRDCYDCNFGIVTQSNNIGSSFVSNIIDSYFRSNSIADNFTDNVIGTDFSYNEIFSSSSFVFNAIGNLFQNNTIGNSFIYNNIANDFIHNDIACSFSYNVIADGFRFNEISRGDFNTNNIGSLCANNVFKCYIVSTFIGTMFQRNYICSGQMQSNVFGIAFDSNTLIVNIFNSNVFGDNCTRNVFNSTQTNNNNFGATFQNNNYIANGWGSYDYTLGTYCKLVYNKTIQLNEASQLVLSYLDTLNVLQVVPATT